MTNRNQMDPTPYALRNHRIAAGLTGREVAAAMGTPQSAVSRLERTRQNPSARTLARYFAAVGRDDLAGLFASPGNPGAGPVTLQSLRERAGLTVTRVATLMGDRPQVVSRMTVGFDANPRAALLGRYFAAVGRDDLATFCANLTDRAGVAAISDVLAQPGRRVLASGPLPGGGVLPMLCGAPVPVDQSGPVESAHGAVRSFLTAATLPGGQTPPRKLYRAYKAWCEATDRVALRERTFLGELHGLADTTRVASTGQRAFAVTVAPSM